MHLIAEASSAAALSRAMQGLCVRIARALNRWMGRRGKLFADRFHEEILRTPRQVRYALHYVLSNAKRHGLGPTAWGWVDAKSSAPWFDGWARSVRWDERAVPERAPPTAEPHTWLLGVGWRRAGATLSPDRRPGPAR